MKDRPLTVSLMLESDGPGGAEKMVLLLADELRERGFRVCPVGPEVGLGWLEKEFRQRGFRPERFHLRRPLDVRCLAGLVRTLRRRRIDVIHAHEFTMAVYGAAAAVLLRRPLVVTMHGGRSYQDRRRRRIALRWALGQSAKAVAVSESTRTELAASLNVNEASIRVIPNGIRPEPGNPARPRRELAIGKREILILSVGNLYPVKGHEVLLRALGRLHNRRPGLDWRLAIAGRGRKRESLEALARERGIGSLVHFLGHRDDVPDLLSAADVFVMPSFSEGLPLALLEAMFAGKAIAASSVGGIPEAVQGERDALLVPPGDDQALASAMERLLTDPWLRSRLGVRAKRRAAGRFSASGMATRYADIYQSAYSRA